MYILKEVINNVSLSRTNQTSGVVVVVGRYYFFERISNGICYRTWGKECPFSIFFFFFKAVRRVQEEAVGLWLIRYSDKAQAQSRVVRIMRFVKRPPKGRDDLPELSSSRPCRNFLLMVLPTDGAL